MKRIKNTKPDMCGLCLCLTKTGDIPVGQGVRRATEGKNIFKTRENFSSRAWKHKHMSRAMGHFPMGPEQEASLVLAS